jgi:hypothetical protein
VRNRQTACGHGAFVAAFRNRAEIVLAHGNRKSPKSAALPFPQTFRSLGRRNHDGPPFFERTMHVNTSQCVNGPRGARPAAAA